MSHKNVFEITFVSDANQTYIFRYTNSTATQMLKLLGSMAANPELDLTWQDASEIGTMIRKLMNVDFPN